MAVLVLVLLSTILVYLFLKWNYSYWTRKGVYQVKPVFFFGNVKDFTFGKASFGDNFKDLYNEIKSRGLKHGGIYQLFKATYMPTDLDIIKNIFQKDFNYFRNHANYVNEEVEPITGHLFALHDEKWRNLRAKLTPTFTTGKMKMMFPIMVACSHGLVDVLEEYVQLKRAVDVKDVISRFSTDIIGRAAFGIECNSLKNPDSEFRRNGDNLFKKLNMTRRIKRVVATTLPGPILGKIGFKLIDQEMTDFFTSTVKNTVNYREKNNVIRKDFLHLLLQLKNRGKVTNDDDFKQVEGEVEDNLHFLTLNELTAQCFVFFIAGYETSSTAITFALLELAQNPEIQNRLRNEIETVLQKHDNQITYESIMEMKYLDMVVNETLRKHPPVPTTTRVCNKAYKVPDTDLVIEEGVRVLISILGIHRDPEYYPDPERFDPERFNEKNRANRHNYAFLTFGEGPRICIGSRFGILQIKVGLVTIIKHFGLSVNNKTKLPIKYAPRSSTSYVEGGVWLNLHVHNNTSRN